MADKFSGDTDTSSSEDDEDAGSVPPSDDGKILVAFDFDNTLVESEGDDPVIERRFSQSAPCSVFRPAQQNNEQSYLYQMMNDIRFLPGMVELLHELKKNGHEIIIISDCNSLFIDHTLRKAGLQDCILKVFTNPAWFDHEGHLRMAEYHHQDWCELCPANLCKGHVLRSYILKRRGEGQEFSSVAYVGDGYNDFCPSLLLSDRDMVFPRRNYSLHRSLLSNHKRPIKCQIIPWDNGFQLQNLLMEKAGHASGR